MVGKLTELTVDNTPLITDIIEYTTDPAGTPLTRSTTLQGLKDLLVAPAIYAHAGWQLNTTVTNTRYSGFMGGALLVSGESDVQSTTLEALTLKFVKLNIQTNSQDGSTIVGFRDDAATVTGSDITVTTTSTGDFDTGTITQAIASGSEINFLHDHNASTSGTFGYRAYYAKLELQ